MASPSPRTATIGDGSTESPPRPPTPTAPPSAAPRTTPHTALPGTRRRQALLEGGLHQARRSSSRQCVLQALNTGRAAERCAVGRKHRNSLARLRRPKPARLLVASPVSIPGFAEEPGRSEQRRAIMALVTQALYTALASGQPTAGCALRVSCAVGKVLAPRWHTALHLAWRWQAVST